MWRNNSQTIHSRKNLTDFVPNEEKTLACRQRNKFREVPSYTLSGTTFDVKHFDKFLKRSP